MDDTIANKSIARSLAVSAAENQWFDMIQPHYSVMAIIPDI